MAYNKAEKSDAPMRRRAPHKYVFSVEKTM